MNSIIEFILAFGFFVCYPLIMIRLAIKFCEAFIDEIYNKENKDD